MAVSIGLRSNMHKNTRFNWFSYTVLKYGIAVPICFIAKALKDLISNRKYKVEEEVVTDKAEEIIEELSIPEFMQVFDIDADTVLGIECIYRCPDETAFVRVVHEDTFSNQYKRKVRYDKETNAKYIVVSNKKYYIKEVD